MINKRNEERWNSIPDIVIAFIIGIFVGGLIVYFIFIFDIGDAIENNKLCNKSLSLEQQDAYWHEGYSDCLEYWNMSSEKMRAVNQCVIEKLVEEVE
jgi:hypothetical protein